MMSTLVSEGEGFTTTLSITGALSDPGLDSVIDGDVAQPFKKSNAIAEHIKMEDNVFIFLLILFPMEYLLDSMTSGLIFFLE